MVRMSLSFFSARRKNFFRAAEYAVAAEKVKSSRVLFAS
jgi:hypothetical protein